MKQTLSYIAPDKSVNTNHYCKHDSLVCQWEGVSESWENQSTLTSKHQNNIHKPWIQEVFFRLRKDKHIPMFADSYLLTSKLSLNSFNHYLQSISRAWPFLPINEMNWSMIPHGILAKSCSAFWQAKAFLVRDTGPLGLSWSKKVYVATSSAAELDTPPPTGTDEMTTASNDLRFPINSQ